MVYRIGDDMDGRLFYFIQRQKETSSTSLLYPIVWLHLVIRSKDDAGFFKAKIDLQTSLVHDLLDSLQKLVASNMEQEMEWRHLVATQERQLALMEKKDHLALHAGQSYLFVVKLAKGP